VHVFAEAEGVRGVAIGFGEELHAGDEGRDAAAWLLAAPSGRPIVVPRGDVPHLQGVIDAITAESIRPVDAVSVQVRRHLLATVLLWLERWYDASRTERRRADDEDVELHRRFARLVEAEFVAHHDAGWYADALRVPASSLSRALVRATGRGTKEHVTDRVMLEAQRLLRFTELTVGEVGARVGFADPLYFSRAFKRHAGESPLAYRGRVRGKSMHP
jgi:AraC family transcriptional activator of pobA